MTKGKEKTYQMAEFMEVTGANRSTVEREWQKMRDAGIFPVENKHRMTHAQFCWVLLAYLAGDVCYKAMQSLRDDYEAEYDYWMEGRTSPVLLAHSQLTGASTRIEFYVSHASLIARCASSMVQPDAMRMIPLALVGTMAAKVADVKPVQYGKVQIMQTLPGTTPEEYGMLETVRNHARDCVTVTTRQGIPQAVRYTRWVPEGQALDLIRDGHAILERNEGRVLAEITKPLT